MTRATPYYLYRCYDAAGVLLYIGCTSSPKRRLGVHQASRRQAASLLLQRHMETFVVDADKYPSRAVGEAAEREAIAAKQPLFNLQHRRVPGWLVKTDIARYVAGEPTRDWLSYLDALEKAAS